MSWSANCQRTEDYRSLCPQTFSQQSILHSAGYLGQKIIFAGGRTKKLQN